MAGHGFFQSERSRTPSISQEDDRTVFSDVEQGGDPSSVEGGADGVQPQFDPPDHVVGYLAPTVQRYLSGRSWTGARSFCSVVDPGGKSR